MSNSKKIPTDGGRSLGQNPFASLVSGKPAQEGAGSPVSKSAPPDTGTRAPAPLAGPVASAPAPRNRGRVDIIRETGGRAGKTVTVVAGFAGIGLPEKERLAKQMRAACGCGGTVKDGRIEIQGDQREAVARILAEAGFRPVFAGG